MNAIQEFEIQKQHQVSQFRKQLVYGYSTLRVRFNNTVLAVPPLAHKEESKDLRKYILKKQFRKRICEEVAFSPHLIDKVLE